MAASTWKTLVSISHADRAGRNRFRLIIRQRMHRALASYLTPQHCEALFAMLQTTDSAISGSLPWSIISTEILLSAKDLPHDINILAPVDTFRRWDDLMVTIGYTRWNALVIPVHLQEQTANARRYWNDMVRLFSSVCQCQLTLIYIFLRMLRSP